MNELSLRAVYRTLASHADRVPAPLVRNRVAGSAMHLTFLAWPLAKAEMLAGLEGPRAKCRVSPLRGMK